MVEPSPYPNDLLLNGEGIDFDVVPCAAVRRASTLERRVRPYRTAVIEPHHSCLSDDVDVQVFPYHPNIIYIHLLVLPTTLLPTYSSASLTTQPF